MIKRYAGILVFAACLASPAMAATMCQIGEPGLRIEFGFQIGDDLDGEDRDEINLNRLRQIGVDATRAEMWSGCIRAFVRKPEGGEEMQFFRPDTLERVEL